MKYNVERVDLPVPDSRPGRSYRFPFDELDVGECFVIKGMLRNMLGPYKRYAEKHLGRKFVTKKVDSGIACWRIE